MWILLLAASAAVICGFAYALGMYLEARLVPERPVPASSDLFFVFVVPCLDEERVLRATLDRVTSLAYNDFLVLVVDDGSSDATFTIADSYPDRRVHVLRRTAPRAREGKGAALNAAIDHLLRSDLLDRPPEGVIVGLLDADGRLDPQAPQAVAAYFADRRTGAVQVSVRIGNRADGLLTRLQDMEFVTQTKIFQIAHNRLGIAGLGGNGQFTRLEALLGLGPSPWSDTLTEDLDLGVRLQMNGWSTMHCPTVSVHQQGLGSLRRLIRQRSRWFQGNLQAWKLLPLVVRRSSGRVAAETLHVLLMPVLVLMSSLMVLSLLASAVGIVASPLARADMLQTPPLLSWYLLTFLPGTLFGYIYRRSGERMNLLQALAYGHAFILYGLLWMIAGWWAVLRAMSRRRTWLKTARVPTTRVSTGRPRRSQFRRSAPPVPTPMARESGRAGRRAGSLVLLVGALAAATAMGSLHDDDRGTRCRPWREGTTRGDWRLAYDGYGTATGSSEAGDWRYRLRPQAATEPDETHASLAVNERVVTDLRISARLRTQRQLRPEPNPWEVAWLVWHYSDDQHFYYVALKPNGWELGKEDPAYPGAQRYLAARSSPTFPVGRWYEVEVHQTGNEIRIAVDGQPLVQVHDNERPYVQGRVGLYTEDADAEFTDIRIHQIESPTANGR